MVACGRTEERKEERSSWLSRSTSRSRRKESFSRPNFSVLSVLSVCLSVNGPVGLVGSKRLVCLDLSLVRGSRWDEMRAGIGVRVGATRRNMFWFWWIGISQVGGFEDIVLISKLVDWLKVEWMPFEIGCERWMEIEVWDNILVVGCFVKWSRWERRKVKEILGEINWEEGRSKRASLQDTLLPNAFDGRFLPVSTPFQEI